MSENPLVKLLSYILPSEFNEYFDLTDVKEEERGVEKILHLYLHEKNIQPDGHTDLSPNGFYPESCINHFPLNEHRTVLHVCRRRWKDGAGKTYSRDWELTAKGKRHTKEFAAFLKEFLGYIPDYSQITPETVSHQGLRVRTCLQGFPQRLPYLERTGTCRGLACLLQEHRATSEH